MISRKHKGYFYVLSFALVGLFFLINAFDLAQSVEYRVLDIFRSEHKPHPEIVIAAIDNKSISEIGRWPWDRRVHADFLTRIQTYNPRLLAFDVSFSEHQGEADDEAFQTALENAKFPTILGAVAIYKKGQRAPERILKPIYPSAVLGHVNIEENEDGIMREFPVPLTISGETFLPLSFKVAELLGAKLPKQNNLLVDFAGSAGKFRTISYVDIVSGRVDEKFIEDSIILVGATASDLQDHLLAPVSGKILSGIEWHANVVDNILLDRWIRLSPKYASIILGIFLSILILVIPLSAKTGTVSKIFAAIAIGLPALSFGMWRYGIALPFFINLLAVTLIFVTRSSYRWYETEIERRRLHKTIQNRFSPQVVNAILRDPKLLKLGGERKEVTVLFSDIRSFTTLSETISPETLSSLLHEYFTEMTEEVLATDGVLDKFIGDAVMAFWGAPIEQRDQADRAVRAALGMLKRLKVLQQKWEEKGWPFVDIGIGIHTGQATVGNMGSEKRFDYTVIGDTVNAASRLEGLNKEYKTHCIISEATKNKLITPVETKSLGDVLVKGKQQSISIFEVLSF